MDACENARRIIAFDRPERIVAQCPDHVLAYLGCNHEGFDGGGHHLPVGSHWTDIWGTVWFREHGGVMGFPREFPLNDLPHQLAGYQWPDAADERIHGGIAARLEQRPDGTMLAGVNRDTLWEKSYTLVGMDTLMCYFYTEPEAVRELLHRVMDFQLAMAHRYVDAGIELAYLSDDLGTQSGLLFSRDILEEFFVPEYRRLFSFYKDHGVLVNFHSCGHIEPVLDTLMDLGVDVLNPVQSTANDLEAVRRRTQGRMALQGGVSSGLVVSGPVAAIRKEAIARMWQLGRDGGYFCRPDQSMPWPEEHARALESAVAEYGAYPLVPPEEVGEALPQRPGVPGLTV
jgi:uroporphyrinogen decarboxylase